MRIIVTIEAGIVADIYLDPDHDGETLCYVLDHDAAEVGEPSLFEFEPSVPGRAGFDAILEELRAALTAAGE